MLNSDLNHENEIQLREKLRDLQERLELSESARLRAEVSADQLRLELMRKTHEIEQIIDIVERFIVQGFYAAQAQKQQVAQLLSELNHQYGEDESMPMLLDLITLLLQFLLEAHQMTEPILPHPGEQRWDAISFEKRLTYLRKIDEGGLLMHIYWFLVKGADLISDNPAALCYQIIRECRVDGTPSVNTLKHLKPWLNRYIPGTKISTIKAALTLIQAGFNSGLNNNEFAYECGIDARYLRVYRGWWNIIADKADTLSDELRDLLANINCDKD